jgi:hypothetical protein
VPRRKPKCTWGENKKYPSLYRQCLADAEIYLVDEQTKFSAYLCEYHSAYVIRLPHTKVVSHEEYNHFRTNLAMMEAISD